MRKDAIDEYLKESKELLQYVISCKEIPKIQVKVKAILEHLRSCLDYSARDIASKLSGPKSRDIYFPYGADLKGFEYSINKKDRLPLLKDELPEVYDEFIKLHDFKSGEKWLKNFCEMTNKTKHVEAIDVKSNQENVKQTTVMIEGLSNPFVQNFGNATTIVNGLRIGDKTVDDFVVSGASTTIVRPGDLSVSFKITKDRKIIVGDNELDLVPFLEKCIKNIEYFMNEVYFKLEKI